MKKIEKTMNLDKDFALFAKSKGVPSTTLDKYKKLFPQASLTPAIVEERNLNIAIMDVFSRLMMDRIIFLGTEIDDYVANVISAQFLYLTSIDKTADIKLYINSPCGSVYDGNSILDVMDLVETDVATVCTGLAASMAAVILSHGTEGKRCSLSRSRVMIHQPLGGTWGQASDIEIEAKEIKKIKRELVQTLADNTKQPFKKVWRDCDRDKWLDAKEALGYGLIDKILSK